MQRSCSVLSTVHALPECDYDSKKLNSFSKYAGMTSRQQQVFVCQNFTLSPKYNCTQLSFLYLNSTKYIDFRHSIFRIFHNVSLLYYQLGTLYHFTVHTDIKHISVNGRKSIGEFSLNFSMFLRSPINWCNVFLTNSVSNKAHSSQNKQNSVIVL